MSTLAERRCVNCAPGTRPLDATTASRLLAQIGAGWSISPDGRSLAREWRFADFHRTMAFVNAVAWIAHVEDHHPDFETGYNYCRIRYSTHSVGGLSENDFICAAKIDALDA
jgi:4a-hydroxytetrahydrobiopterin dehydratase